MVPVGAVVERTPVGRCAPDTLATASSSACAQAGQPARDEPFAALAAVSFGGDDRLVSQYMESEFLGRISPARQGRVPTSIGGSGGWRTGAGSRDTRWPRCWPHSSPP